MVEAIALNIRPQKFYSLTSTEKGKQKISFQERNNIHNIEYTCLQQFTFIVKFYTDIASVC